MQNPKSGPNPSTLPALSRELVVSYYTVQVMTNGKKQPPAEYTMFVACLFSYRTFCSASHALIRPTSASLSSNDAEAKALSRAAAKALWISDASFFHIFVYAFGQKQRRFVVMKGGQGSRTQKTKAANVTISRFPSQPYHEEVLSVTAFLSEAERDS